MSKPFVLQRRQSDVHVWLDTLDADRKHPERGAELIVYAQIDTPNGAAHRIKAVATWPFCPAIGNMLSRKIGDAVLATLAHPDSGFETNYQPLIDDLAKRNEEAQGDTNGQNTEPR